MNLTDPATGRPLPTSDSSYQRILFVSPTVHIYNIPPLTSSTKGFSASSWTSPNQPTAQKIFTARLRVIETTLSSTHLKTDIVLEDPDKGDLFAAAPYTSAAVVQQANDSSRFFALRVQGEGGMKATLGIGFEDRSPAFDFSVALGEARKALGWEGTTGMTKGLEEQSSKKDFSLKEGEKIHIQVGEKGRRAASPAKEAPAADPSAALFSIAPPPPAGKAHAEPSFGSSAQGISGAAGKSAQELGFDDGEFGEFQ